MMTEEDISMFELGEFLPPVKKDILDTLYRQFTINDLKSIFKNHFNVNV